MEPEPMEPEPMEPEPRSELHPEAEALTFLLGTWRGEGTGEFPTIEPFRYGEEMRFEQVGDPFLLYSQRSWLLDETFTPLHFERGFYRPGGDGRIEITLAHPLGLTEVSEGTLRGTRIQVASTIMGSTRTGDPVTQLARTIEVDDNILRYELQMATTEVPLVRHCVAELQRV